MSGIGLAISGLFSRIASVLSTYHWLSDTLDILLIAVVAYYFLKIIKDTRAITIVKGFLVLAVAYVLVLLLDMKASAYLFSRIFNNILVILVVLFAPEIRKFMEQLGNSRRLLQLRSMFTRGSSAKVEEYNRDVVKSVNAITSAAADMSEEKVGALIIFEKETPIGEIIDTGTVVDAAVSSQLIGNIFYPKSPLHDGAAVIRNNRIFAAGCILPLTARNNDVAKELGTRHRAALGMSEQSDAVVLVVSEETGAMSIAEGGRLHRNLSDGDVREMLQNALLLKEPEESEPADRTTFFDRFRKGGGKDGK